VDVKELANSLYYDHVGGDFMNCVVGIGKRVAASFAHGTHSTHLRVGQRVTIFNQQGQAHEAICVLKGGESPAEDYVLYYALEETPDFVYRPLKDPEQGMSYFLLVSPFRFTRLSIPISFDS